MAIKDYSSQLSSLVPYNDTVTWKDVLYSNTAARHNLLAPPSYPASDGFTYQYAIDDSVSNSLQAVIANIYIPLASKFQLHINSGYRSLPTNKYVGGQPTSGGNVAVPSSVTSVTQLPSGTSQHVKGQALDLINNSGSNSDLFAYIYDKSNMIPFDQLIWEFGTAPPDGQPAWVHVSYNPNGNQRGQVLVIDKSGTRAYTGAPPSGAPNNNNQEETSDPTSPAVPPEATAQQNMQALFDEINANQANIEAQDVAVTWGMRASQSETSDWISLKQFLLYLCTHYVPETVFPFIELIPLVSASVSQDNSSVQSNNGNASNGVGQDGSVPKQIQQNYDQSSSGSVFNLFNQVINKISNSNPNPPGGFSPFSNPSQPADDQGGLTELFKIDPWRVAYQDLNTLSKSGQIAFSQRLVGLRVYEQLVLTPGAISGVPTKPGAIGFTSVEVKAGSQSDNGLAMITMKLLDQQGNQFTDVNSPWAFIFDTRPGSEGGDFYFRYGWELRLPDPNGKDSLSTGFWNHPGWALFTQAQKDLIRGLQAPDYKIYLTQGTQVDNVINNYTFNSGVRYDSTNGSISASSSALEGDINNPSAFVRLSILNPELSVDSVSGATTATLTFMTTGAVVQLVPVVAALNTKALVAQAVAKSEAITLAQLLIALVKDSGQFGVLSVSNPDKKRRLDAIVADQQQELLSELLNGQNLGDLVVVLGADSSNGNGPAMSINPNLVILNISKSLNNDLNEVSDDQTKTLIRWFRQVLEDNDCVLLSTATGSGAGINAKYVITTTQNIQDNLKNYNLQQVPPFDPNSPSEQSLVSTLQNEHDVFSFRFQGSLVENIEVSKTDTTNSAAISANFSLNNLATDGVITTNPDGTPVTVTAEDRKRILLATYAQLQNVQITAMAHPWIGPGDYIFVKGMGFFDGRYLALSVTHTLEGHKFTTQLEAARMLPSANTSTNPSDNTSTAAQAANKQNSQANGARNFASDCNKQYTS